MHNPASQNYIVFIAFTELGFDLIFYVKILCDNLAFGETQHHAAQKMKDLHIYFAEKYDGGRIDFDILKV